MLKKYSDFISDRILMLLESDVRYSDRMSLALSKLDNPISKFLLDLENKDIPVKTNFFDIPRDNNDKISFIPDKKAQEILEDTKEYVKFIGSGGGWLKHTEANEHLFDELGYTYQPDTKPYSPNSSDIGEIVSSVTSRKSGKTYVYVIFKSGRNILGEGVYNNTKLRPVDNRQKLVWSKGRQEIKIGKAVKALLDISNYEFTDSDLEQFVNQFKATIDKLNDKYSYFDLVKSAEIAHFYDIKNYYEPTGTLNSSCMANSPSEFFDIYVKNPDVCQLLILRSKEDTDKIIGRALLWTLAGGEKFLDRIYYNSDSDMELFKDYAKEMGWYVKEYNNSSASSYAIHPQTGKSVSLMCKVYIKDGSYESYPYMDTFKYLNIDYGTLSTFSGHGDYILEGTDGEYIICDYCGGSGRQGCYNCEESGEVTCRECDGHGSVDCSGCRGYEKIPCVTCDGEGTTEDENGDEQYCEDCEGTGGRDCEDCGGTGQEDCLDCNGRGDVECRSCDGEGETDCGECNY
jgi:hypothetical protein